MLENTIRQYLSSFGIPFSYDNKIVVWENIADKIPPTREETDKKITELEAAEPMRLLRLERNRRLAETDWVVIRAYSQKQDLSEDWANYMQALRDLPATAEPQLDDVGNVTNVNWPEEPNA